MTPELLLALAFLSLGASAAFAYLAWRVWRKKEPEEPAELTTRQEEALPVEVESTASPPPVSAEAPAVAAPAPSVSASAPPPERVIPVASLLRDEVTGGLVVRVGDREYRTARELLASQDRQRMEYTAAELSRWLGAEKAAPRPTPPEPAAKPVPRRPLSMVEQINEILERKLEERPQVKRGVRLAEGAGGGIKVYIGIDAYTAIDDVPDEDVRQLIRDAVAEWEAGQ
jgi:hypothetical protein